jgi:hypothetical protein
MKNRKKSSFYEENSLVGLTPGLLFFCVRTSCLTSCCFVVTKDKQKKLKANKKIIEEKRKTEIIRER